MNNIKAQIGMGSSVELTSYDVGVFCNYINGRGEGRISFRSLLKIAERRLHEGLSMKAALLVLNAIDSESGINFYS